SAATSEDKGFDELRARAAALGADAVIGAEFGPKRTAAQSVRPCAASLVVGMRHPKRWKRCEHVVCHRRRESSSMFSGRDPGTALPVTGAVTASGHLACSFVLHARPTNVPD